MIKVENVTKNYGKLTALKNASFEVRAGEIFGIIGYSGAGKSTLLRCLNMLEQPTSGTIRIDTVTMTTLNKRAIRQQRLKIGMIFQHFSLIQTRTVKENIAFALKAAGVKGEASAKRVAELLQLVDLQDKGDFYPAQLSGGQKQRVGIARALANEPKLLLCDEATSALDPTTTEAILQLLQDINKKLGITIVLITHEMDVVQQICDRLAVMQDGEIIEQGEVYDIFAAPKTQLAKQFVDTVHALTLPQPLLQQTTGTVLQIIFRGDAAQQDVIAQAVQQFHIRLTILHGQITYIKNQALGTLIVEVIGTAEEQQKAQQYIAQITHQVEVIQYAKHH